MTLDQAEALKAELMAEPEPPAMSLVQSRIDTHALNGFLRSVLNRPVRELPQIFSTREPMLLGAAQSGGRIKAAAIPAMRALSAQGEANDAQPAVSIGFSTIAKNDYRLEVRLQQPNVATILYAQEIVRRANGQARIGEYHDLKAHARPAAPLPAAGPKLSIGDSIGHPKCPPGTLGLFMRSPEGVGVLSNSHVLARCGRARRGDPIHSPHPRDATASPKIGHLREFSNLIMEDDVPFDAAFALLEDGVAINGNTIPSPLADAGKKIVAARGKVEPGGLKVCKIGRTTRQTTGTLDSIAQSPTVEYDGVGKVKLTGMMEILWDKLDEPFSDGGDSGSVVYRQDTLGAIGIVVGGGILEVEGVSKGVTVACPLETIAAQWNLSLV